MAAVVLLALLALALLIAGSARPLITYARAVSAHPARSAEASSAGSNGAPQFVRSTFDLKIVDYYPSRAGWTSMWNAWNPSIVDRDFQTIAALGANTVRVIVQVPAFGYPRPRPLMQHRLSQMLSIAHRHGLRVELTLFDWWSEYTDVAGSKQWAGSILRPYSGDRRIAFVELQNEVDPADGSAMAWAGRLIPYVRQIAGGIPVSLSISGRGGIPMLARLKHELASTPPDIYDLHYYGAAALAYVTFREARQIVAPAPLINGETGYSTMPGNRIVAGLAANATAQELYQDQYYRTVEYAAGAAGLKGVGVWTLNDFAPHAIPDSTTARDPTQYHLGLYRENGLAKPAAAAIRSIFSEDRIDASFDNGFETDAGGMPANWLVWQPNEAQFARDPGVAHSGAASARISRSGGDSSGVPAFFSSPITTITPHTLYHAGVWVRGLNATGENRLGLAWFDAAGGYLAQNESSLLPNGTTSWIRLSVEASAPAGAAFVQIHLKSAHDSGTVWFDDVTFGGRVR